MELKHHGTKYPRWCRSLLIVPYGIETNNLLSVTIFPLLLIVPYGIETIGVSLVPDRILILLIVPYGIETF